MRGGEGGIPIRTLSRLGLQPQVGPEKAASPTRPGKGLEGIDEAEGNATDRVGSSPPPERQSISPRAKRQSRWTSSGRQVALRHCSSAARIGPPARHIGAWPLFAKAGPATCIRSGVGPPYLRPRHEAGHTIDIHRDAGYGLDLPRCHSCHLTGFADERFTARKPSESECSQRGGRGCSDTRQSRVAPVP